jgi:hypothetical protein
MADEDLRQRQREAALADEPEAAARLLQARLRAGELDRGRLELLAYLDHPGARRAAGAGDWEPARDIPLQPVPALRLDHQPEELWHWACGLAPWGRAVCARAALGAAGAGLEAWEARPRACAACGDYGQVQVPFAQTFEWVPCEACYCKTCLNYRRAGGEPCSDCVDLRPRRLLADLLAWLDDPRDERVGRIREAALDLQAEVFEPLAAQEPWAYAAYAACLTALLALGERMPEGAGLGEVLCAAVVPAGEAEARAGAVRALTRWALRPGAR